MKYYFKWVVVVVERCEVAFYYVIGENLNCEVWESIKSSEWYYSCFLERLC